MSSSIRSLRFTKMNGAGNDFVMVDNRAGFIALSGAEIARLCDRHRGVGADGLIAVERAEAGADARMRYYNRDGGEAEMCGNGARCFARFAARLGDVFSGDELRFETPAGVIGARLEGDLVTIRLSDPVDFVLGTTLEIDGQAQTVHSVNTGVPHAVVACDDVDAVDLRRLGAAIRYHDHFAPAGTNVNLFEVRAPGCLKMRTYERGVEDETLACGTGMAACALVHHALAGGRPAVTLEVAGGDRLEVGFSGEAGRYRDVRLTGPADIVFTGEVPLDGAD